jgi:hypothetical protein
MFGFHFKLPNDEKNVKERLEILNEAKANYLECLEAKTDDDKVKN